MVFLANITSHKLRGVLQSNITKEENKPLNRAGRLCRRFSLNEIQLGTSNFSDALVIGKGGCGNVYKCLIDGGRDTVAIKRLKSNSKQGEHEFLAEVETLSELRHVNLVSLIGYCTDHGEMILVYSYMLNGNLADHLYKLERNGNNSSSLSWKQRIDICIGAGRGLDYLHTGRAVIHRDVKVSNILLDGNFTAKISDLGLVKHEDKSNAKSHAITKVKGTFGYLDPSYLSTGKLTRKSDVYAFGVVLVTSMLPLGHSLRIDPMVHQHRPPLVGKLWPLMEEYELATMVQQMFFAHLFQEHGLPRTWIMVTLHLKETRETPQHIGHHFDGPARHL